jgi:hypothetical protein
MKDKNNYFEENIHEYNFDIISDDEIFDLSENIDGISNINLKKRKLDNNFDENFIFKKNKIINDIRNEKNISKNISIFLNSN